MPANLRKLQEDLAEKEVEPTRKGSEDLTQGERRSYIRRISYIRQYFYMKEEFLMYKGEYFLLKESISYIRDVFST